MGVAVILPTYNERENIEALVRELLSLNRLDHIIVVDDNSPDGTGVVVDGLAASDARVIAVHRPSKQGLGRAYIAGFQRALELGSSVVITMDADFSHHPRYIPAMLDLLANGHDVVIGSRYVDGGGTANWGVERRFLSAGANAFARLLLGLHAHDCTAGFRAYRRRVLETVPFQRILSEGYSFLVEMLFHCQRLGFRIGEVPILFEDRRQGRSKINQAEIIKAVGTVFRLARDRLVAKWRASRRGPRQIH